jgi:predicted transcriptional regulator
MDTKLKLVELTAQIVAAYVGHNAAAPADIHRLIAEVHRSLEATLAGAAAETGADLRPPVPIRKSVTSEYIVCLEDGKRFKSLKRHLRSQYNMTPEQYREKWNLPADYPMVAPKYAETRSRLAKHMGLGRQRGKA